MKNQFAAIELQSLLTPFLESSLNLHTRVHPLQSKIYESGKLFIKREDELSSGISGSKYRKYASLIPFLLKENFDEVVIIGGSNSNNVIASMQLFRENKIPFHLMLLENHSTTPKGNELWMKMLLGEEKVQYITRDEWENIDSITDNYKKEKERQEKKIFVLREGAEVLEAIPGAMTLALDILQNEDKNNISFNHIFIDSGLGISAIGLILGLEYLGLNDKEIHLTLIAGTEDEFNAKLEFFRENISTLLSIPEADSTIHVKFHTPPSAASFGSINDNIIQKTISIAKKEGILMEPVYSVKHFMSMEEVLSEGKTEGDALFIYNGGALGLAGFAEKLSLQF